MTKTIPFSKEQIDELRTIHPTPFHVYDEKTIRRAIRDLKNAFSWADFTEYFAVKANPNPFILKLLKEEGAGVDCSSLPELLLAEKAGFSKDDIYFTSNNTPAEEFVKAHNLGAIINFDDIQHLSYYEKHVGPLPKQVCFRYNPGNLKAGNAIIGHPEEAKYGFTREQLFEGFRYCKEAGCSNFGLHTMVASNELDYHYFVETAKILFECVQELSKTLDITFDFVNLGGGIGIPYHPDQSTVDLQTLGKEIQALQQEIITNSGMPALKIFMECGRMITGPSGFLVSEVRHKKSTYKEYVGLDACMTDLMRPALYGAYHHISVLGKENAPEELCADITGSLCENNDKFAINRHIPNVVPGDILVIHDTGAHGHAMGFNYNGKTRSAEFLLREDGSFLLIRRAENLEDLFATLDFEALTQF